MVEVCKILFDLCFYYTLSGFYLYIFSGAYPSNWGIPVMLLSAIAFSALKKRIPGFERPGDSKTALLVTAVCCALPVLLLLLDLTLGQIIQFLPAWAYYAYTIWNGRIYTDRGEFEGHFGFTGKLLGLAAFGFVAFSRIGGAISGAIPYLLVYLLTGICLMRVLREEGKLARGRNIVVVLILLLGSIVLTVAQTPQIILSAAGFIYNNIIARILIGVAVAIGAIMYGFILAVTRLVALLSVGGRGSEAYDSLNETAQELFEDVTMRETPVWLETAAMLLLALAVAFVIFLILRRLLGNKAEKTKVRYYSEEQERLQKHERRKMGGVIRPADPRQVVRWYYRKYLKEGVSRGLESAPSDTSLSISKKCSPFFPEDDTAGLRDLYIKARYRYSAEIPKTDANTASEIWRRLKRGK